MTAAVAWYLANVVAGVTLAVFAPLLMDLQTRHRIGGRCDCEDCAGAARWRLAGVVVLEIIGIGAAVVGFVLLIGTAGGQS